MMTKTREKFHRTTVAAILRQTVFRGEGGIHGEWVVVALACGHVGHLMPAHIPLGHPMKCWKVDVEPGDVLAMPTAQLQALLAEQRATPDGIVLITAELDARGVRA